MEEPFDMEEEEDIFEEVPEEEEEGAIKFVLHDMTPLKCLADVACVLKADSLQIELSPGAMVAGQLGCWSCWTGWSCCCWYV